MTILEEIEPYIDDNGLISPNEDGGVSGNGLMYSAEASFCPEIQKEYGVSEMYMFPLYQCQGDYGQWFRTPGRDFGHQSIDDLIAIATLHKEWAEDIEHYMWLGFYYTTPNPNSFFSLDWWKFWYQINLGRFRDFMAHLKICQGEKPHDNDFAVWRAVMTTPCEDDNGWRKTYFYFEAAKNMYPDICKIWVKNLYDRYEGGMSECRAYYHRKLNGHPNAEHPNAKYAPDLRGWL